MKMRRRNTTEDGSLDLLLDTICNMFGLIIFVAILAAVIASVRSRQTAEVPLLATQETMSVNTSPEVQPDDLVADMITSRRAQLDRLYKEIDQREELLDRLHAIVAPENAPVDLDTIRSQTQTLQKDLQRMTQLRDVTLRTPKRRELAGRLPVQVVLAEGRLYILNDWSSWHQSSDPIGDRCVFWTTWNPEAIDLQQPVEAIIHEGCEFRTGTQDIERRVRLLSGGGIPIDETRASVAKITDALSVLDPDFHVVSMRVSADSYAAFQLFRNALVQSRFPYDVTPWIMPADRGYHDRIREGTATAQ